MKKGVIYAVFLILLASFVSADIDDKINSIVKYGEQYEMGQISYLQMIVHSNVLRHDINEMLSEKIEIPFGIGPSEYGATEEEMRRIFGAPTHMEPWVMLAHEDKKLRIDERMPTWEKTIFDGKKLKITFNAWPNAIVEEDGSLTKFYWIDFDTRFKKKFDFNVDSMTSNIKSMAESFLETNEGGQELAEKMAEYRNILHRYLDENRENCPNTIKEFFEDDEKVFDIDVTRWDIYVYEGDNLELKAEVISCDDCEWPHVDIWFVLNIRDIRTKEADIKYKKFYKEKYRTMTIDELNSLIEKNLERLVRKAEQADQSRSGNIIRDMVEARAEIRVINQVLDEKYYGGIEEKEKRQENYKKRMQALESIFSKYGDIDMYPLEQVLWERRILEITEERQDSFCRELKQDECGKDDVCWEGECINAIGGDETCDNRIDDDKDHAIDCDDPDCYLECGRACDHICSGECWDCHEEQCGDICEEECRPCYNEHDNNQGWDNNPCENACIGCNECMDNQCNSQPACAECTACNQETYQCFDTCNSCDECQKRGLGGCEEECNECDNCKATDTQRECLSFCDALGDERVDEHVVRCKDMCRQDVIFICPTGKQYIPCDNVHYVCDGVFIESVPCLIYECEGGIKQTAPCGQEIMCGLNQYADFDKCLCEEGFYDCDDNKMDCEATKECHTLIEDCKDKIDNDEDGLTDCQDLLDCKTGATCGQGPADEPMYCYEGECALTTCGNEICDNGETIYSCPPDCKFTDPVCGDDICSGNETEESCYEDCSICPEGQILNEKGICVDPVICPIGYININDTCVPPPGKCIKEGKIFDKMEKPDAMCCEGLTKLDMAWPDEQVGREDVCIATETWEQTCTKCGDGKCGKGENWCICPEDCPLPEEIPCSADVDCGIGFCSQKKNVCHGTTYACLEGNCSGVSSEYENFYCIDSVCIDSCGDSICEYPENKNLCPEDCRKEVISCNDSLDCPSQMKCENSVCVDVGCIKEGEMGPSAGINPEWYDHLPTECCEGLKSITYSGLYDENCDFVALVGGPSEVCTRCGDGQCGKGETKCNCPEDCREVECTSDNECTTTGCSGQVCAGVPVVTDCGIEPWFQCLELSNCGCYDSECKWEENLAYLECRGEKLCGNGIIDPYENCANCPKDAACEKGFSCENMECVLLNITCDKGFVLNDEGKCVPITCEKGQEVNEEGICVDICGNGRIDKREDCESCPQDVICKIDYVCENKKCVPGINITCPEGQVLDEDGKCVKECLKEGEFTMEVKDCCPGLKAMRTQVGDGRTCSLTAGYVCTGLCGDGDCEGLENPCNCKKDCPIPDEVNVSCTADSDCGTDTCHQGGSTCNEIMFACEEGECSAISTEYEGYSCARYYSSELSYPENTKCLDTCGDGVCKRPENKNWCPEDCKEKELCGNNVIDPEENCKSCPSDVICQEGYTCEDGECIPMLGVCPEGMEPNEVDQCVEICGNGRIDDEEDCESCPKDISCRDDFVCENKECVPEEIICPDGYVLSEKGKCELIIECKKDQQLTEQGCIPIEDDCRYDDDCIGKEECKAGVCVAPPRPKCETDEECPQNKICSDGICVKNIETPGPPEPEPTGEECILASDCSGENDICSNGECKEIPEEFIEEEIIEEEEEVIEEEPEEEIVEEEEEEIIEEEPEEAEEEEVIEEEAEPVEEEKPKKEKGEKKTEAKEEKPTKKPEPVQEVSETQSVSDDAQKASLSDKPEITGESVFNIATGYATILGLAVEDRCKEDSDCGTNQNCEPFMGNCHCKEYYFDCNSRDGQGNDEDGCESEDPTCGGKREMCGGKCQENQHCDEERGHCMCDEGFDDCDGYWGNGCESEKSEGRCEGCEDDSDCIQDVCAPWDMKHVINFGCVQGPTWEEETGVIFFGGGCNFLPTGVVESYMGFDAWGDSFDQVQWYQEATQQLDRHWCDYQLEHLTKQRIELQKSYNQEFLEWFFDEYVNSNVEQWDKYSGGIYDVYWKFVDNSRETNRNLRCLNLNKFPSEYEMVNEIEYESENGHVRFWEEKAIVDGVEIFSPFMQVWVFPPKEFIKEDFRRAMEEGTMPGPPENKELGPSPAEIKEAKEDKKFMEEITEISDDFGGSADFLITINDEDEILYKAMLTINPEIIFRFEVKDIVGEPDVTISVDFDFMYGIIEDIEKHMELERPPWDERPRMREKIKGAVDKGKMIVKITGAIATGKIKIKPLSAVGKVIQVLKFMFDQGPEDKGPKDKEQEDQGPKDKGPEDKGQKDKEERDQGPEYQGPTDKGQKDKEEREEREKKEEKEKTKDKGPKDKEPKEKNKDR